jgi:hypothetical protein
MGWQHLQAKLLVLQAEAHEQAGEHCAGFM